MNEKNMDKIINAASKKLGTSPEKLRQTLETGDMKTLSASLSKSDKEKLRAVLENKELVNKLKKATDPKDVMRLLNENER